MNKPIHLLLVEDNLADADLTREGFATSTLPIELAVASNGSDAIDYLRKRGRYGDVPTPDMVLLDLNLPGIDGRAVLKEVKQDAVLRRIPVLIVSSSTAAKDLFQSYQLGANSYVVKPIDFKGFCKVLQTLEDFWFSTAKLPPEDCGEEAKTQP